MTRGWYWPWHIPTPFVSDMDSGDMYMLSTDDTELCAGVKGRHPEA